MSFLTGSIKGSIGLDKTPAVTALRETVREASQTKQAVERDLGNLKAAINTQPVKSAKADFQDFSNVVHRTKEDLESIPESVGVFDRVALNAKKVQMDDRMSGEIALGRFAGRGLGGMADMGMSMLGLGAAGMVISGIAQGLNEAITKANELSAEIKKGNANYADMAMSIGKSLPVLGEVFNLGETIADQFKVNIFGLTFGGVKSDVEDANQSIEKMNTLMEAQRALAEAWKKAIEGATDRLRSVSGSNEVMRLTLQGRDQQATQVGIANETQNATVSETRQYDADKEALQKAFKERQDAARALANVGGRGVTEDVRKKRQEQSNNELLAAQKDFNEKMKTLEQTHQANLAAIQEQGSLKSAIAENNSPANQLLRSLREQAEFAGKSTAEASVLKAIRAGSLTKQSDIDEALKLAKNIDMQTKAIEEEKKKTEDLQRTKESLADLQRKANEINQTEGQKALEQFRQLKNVTPEMIKEAEKAASAIDAATKQKKTKEDVEKALEDARNPLEKFNAEREKIAGWLASGAITSKQYDQLVNKARNDAFSAFDSLDLSHSQTGGRFAAESFSRNATQDSGDKVKNAVEKVETAVSRVETAIKDTSIWGS